MSIVLFYGGLIKDELKAYENRLKTSESGKNDKLWDNEVKEWVKPFNWHDECIKRWEALTTAERNAVKVKERSWKESYAPGLPPIGFIADLNMVHVPTKKLMKIKEVKELQKDLYKNMHTQSAEEYLQREKIVLRHEQNKNRLKRRHGQDGDITEVISESEMRKIKKSLDKQEGDRKKHLREQRKVSEKESKFSRSRSSKQQQEKSGGYSDVISSESSDESSGEDI